MKTTKYILALTALVSFAFSAFSQSGASGPMSARAIGHVCVEIVSPAAISSVQSVALADLALASAESGLTIAPANSPQASGIELTEGSSSLASFKVIGSTSAYSVTISSEPISVRNDTKILTASNFTTAQSTDLSGAGDIYIGATLHVNEATAATTTPTSSLSVAINYN
jgi:hypothetical protein